MKQEDKRVNPYGSTPISLPIKYKNYHNIVMTELTKLRWTASTENNCDWIRFQNGVITNTEITGIGDTNITVLVDKASSPESVTSSTITFQNEEGDVSSFTINRCTYQCTVEDMHFNTEPSISYEATNSFLVCTYNDSSDCVRFISFSVTTDDGGDGWVTPSPSSVQTHGNIYLDLEANETESKRHATVTVFYELNGTEAEYLFQITQDNGKVCEGFAIQPTEYILSGNAAQRVELATYILGEKTVQPTTGISNPNCITNIIFENGKMYGDIEEYVPQDCVDEGTKPRNIEITVSRTFGNINCNPSTITVQQNHRMFKCSDSTITDDNVYTAKATELHFTKQNIGEGLGINKTFFMFLNQCPAYSLSDDVVQNFTVTANEQKTEEIFNIRPVTATEQFPHTKNGYYYISIYPGKYEAGYEGSITITFDINGEHCSHDLGLIINNDECNCSDLEMSDLVINE